MQLDAAPGLHQYAALSTHSRGLNEPYTVHPVGNSDSQYYTRLL